MVKEFFEKNYKKIIVFPALLLIVSLVFIGLEFSKTGDIFERDVSLKGGISSTIYTEKGFEILDLEQRLGDELKTDVSVRELKDFSTNTRLGYIVNVGDLNVRDNIKNSLESVMSLSLDEDNYSVEEVGSSLGEGFYQDMLKAVVIAFILMGIVVFVAFRSFIPSLAVILSALLDISATLMIVNLLEIKVSTAGIAAFLLVIGYSVDTDILMTTKVLKRKDGGSTIERLIDSAKTGLTMTITTFVALGAGYIVTSSLVLKQMFLIILIALIIDVISTYAMNAGILYWYKERRKVND